MNTLKYLAATTVGLTFALGAPLAQALVVYGSSDTSGSAGGSDTINIDANVSGSASGSSSAQAQDDTDAQGSASVTASPTDASVQVGPIMLTQADVSGQASTSAQATVTASSDVHTTTDLSAYASTLLRSDADASAVSLSSDAVSLGYKSRAMLFGFIPIFVNATATVNAQGQASVSYPWYAFLASKDSASLQGSVQAATAATVSGQASADAALSASQQAQLLDELHTAMRSDLQASLSASQSADVSAH